MLGAAGMMGGMPDLGALESFTGGSASAESGDIRTGAHNHNSDHSITFGNRAQNNNMALYVAAGVAVLAILAWRK